MALPLMQLEIKILICIRRRRRHTEFAVAHGLLRDSIIALLKIRIYATFLKMQEVFLCGRAGGKIKMRKSLTKFLHDFKNLVYIFQFQI